MNVKRNPEVDSFLSRAKRWQKEFERLRRIILSYHELTEELKWGKPCYTFQGRNVIIIQGFKEYCALLFPKGVLLKDARHILIQQTPNVQAARQLRFTNVREIAKMEPAIIACISEAIKLEKVGREVTYKKTSEFKMPEELKNKLDKSAAFKAAFEGLTPGRQRGYILYFSAAKQSRTREARIEKYMQQIFNGKGLYD